MPNIRLIVAILIAIIIMVSIVIVLICGPAWLFAWLSDRIPGLTSSSSPTPTPTSPSFEVVFAIAGLFAVEYFVRRKK